MQNNPPKKTKLLSEGQRVHIFSYPIPPLYLSTVVRIYLYTHEVTVSQLVG